MIELSVNKFRANLKNYVDQAIDLHEPVKITRREGRDFVVLSAEDWERDQETLYILQNSSLMKQISESFKTHHTGEGYKPSNEELDAINSI
ncbi:type II toxin-antitoxin system Phd/YefM family antitoxin [bacterium]|nr:type II toxin-antitoxin system Phd/YefM family antitoxin [bacterium]